MRRKVWLVQQGVWDMQAESMPLAAGYLKAAALTREVIKDEIELCIFNFKGGNSVRYMARSLYFKEIPDIVAFSTYGWNFHKFCALAETFRQINQSGWIIFGGPHVTDQAERVFRLCPCADIIINGEGEATFKELLLAYLSKKSKEDLAEIKGISFKQDNGSIITTVRRPIIKDLNTIPSPFLTKAIELVDKNGCFKYDVALIETNRGCPYGCAFCSWSNDTEKKIRFFSRERLREEIELFAYHRVQSIVLCDSNFGQFENDEFFIEDLIVIKEKYGYPYNIEASWGKNKSSTFFRIAKMMKQSGLRSSFTLALQTLNHEALALMNRSNMDINNYEETVKWLNAEGFDCFAELIWGAPGETYDSFIQGYDQVAKFIPRISVYPLLILPNTHYSKNREKYGLVTIRNNKDDFEYILSHKTISPGDNYRMYQFLFWERIMVENMVFHSIWIPIQKVLTVTQSQVLLSLNHWIERSDDKNARDLIEYRSKMVNDLDMSVIPETLRYIYLNSHNVSQLFGKWWSEEILPLVPPYFMDLFSEIFRYQQLTWPIYYNPADGKQQLPEDIKPVFYNNEQYYVRERQKFGYDIPHILERIKGADSLSAEKEEMEFSIYYKSGFHNYIDNQEFIPIYIGRTYIPERQKVKIIS
jgi:radical SAM superfamily enzyme YgiQ (UPF0313 family)